MRRLLLAVGFLLTILAAETHAGYWVVRVVLQPAPGGGTATGPATPGPTPFGSGEGRPSGPGGRGGGFVPMPMATPAPMTGEADAGAFVGDPSRSIVIVIPVSNVRGTRFPNPVEKLFYPKERNKQPPGNMDNPIWKDVLNHRFGTTNFFSDNKTIELYTEFFGTPSVDLNFKGEVRSYQSEVEDAHAAWLNSRKKKPNGQLAWDAVTGALRHGMADQVMTYADSLLDGYKTTPDAMPAEAKQFAQAYSGLRPRLVTPAPPSTEAAAWQAKLGLQDAKVQIRASGRYTLIYWDLDTREADRRLTQLNDHLRAFYLWHLTRGVTLEVPERSLLAIQVKTGGRLRPLAGPVLEVPDKTFAVGTPRDGELIRTPDGWRLIDGSFYSPEYDMLVLAPERWDRDARTFRVQNQDSLIGLSREMLLRGLGPPLLPHPGAGLPGVPGFPQGPMLPQPLPSGPGVAPTAPAGPASATTPDDAARKMTLAMIERFFQDEVELAGVTREGSTQLLYATGLLPRNVALPQWLRTGTTQVFTRPTGPVYTTSDDGKTVKMTVALTTGYGRPNFVMQKHFKDMPGRKELTTDAAKLLRNVLTDAYFHALSDGDELDAPPPPSNPMATPTPATPTTPGPMPLVPAGPVALDPAVLKRQRDERMAYKAQATAWALCHYLMMEKPEGFRKYADELKKMPRDLPLDDKTGLEVFTRAFDLANPAAFDKFATEWVEKVNGESPAGVDVTLRPPSDPTPNPNAPTPTGPRPGGSIQNPNG